MENVSVMCKEEGRMDLPPGFRFHPTDEELISHYLYKKVIDTNFSARAIGEVDLNRSEPWDLPCELLRNQIFIPHFVFSPFIFIFWLLNIFHFLWFSSEIITLCALFNFVLLGL